MRVSELDRRVYQDYLSETHKDYVGTHTDDYTKYVISAYPYFRSRLLIPGRCYEDDNHGAMAIGGSAHTDIIDLDIWLSRQTAETRVEALDWMSGSSLEQVAYWRGFGRGHKATVSRRRTKIARDITRQANKN